MFWDSTAHMANLSNLLINSVFKELGPLVEERLNSVTRLHGDFIGYVGDVARKGSNADWREPLTTRPFDIESSDEMLKTDTLTARRAGQSHDLHCGYPMVSS